VDLRLLRQIHAQRRAIVGFSIYNLEQGLAVVRAAEAEGVPVILQAGASAFRYSGREPLARLAQGLAESTGVPVGIHLDHARDLAQIDACLRLGYTSVMFDGSPLPIEQNIRLTREVVARAHLAGAWVEAELAGIAGDEDESAVKHAGALTDPDVAAGFVAATGVDALAVAVGNVHGIPDVPVSIDLQLLERIAGKVSVPLVLHGASALADTEVVAAIDLGVAKLNINSELRRAFRDALSASSRREHAGDDIAGILEPVIHAMQCVAQDKLRAFTAPRVPASANGG
jgi:ketose-bisphosphate aldolase